jgi:hypothetical protein
MAIYDTRYGLTQPIVNYLNQGLPSISGIFSNVPTTTTPVVDDTEDTPTGLTPEQLALLYPQNVSGGGDDPYRGGGKFSNLDLSRSKTFTKDVYDEEEGDFVPTELTAYYNPTLGNYQTFEGKNINPGFSNTGLPSFGLGSLAMKMFGLEPQTVGGYVPGSIRGFYDTPIDFFQKRKNEQMATVQQLADQRIKDKARIDALKSMTTNNAGGGQDTSGGNNQPDGSGGYTGGFDSSTNNYNDPYSDDTE